MHSTILMIAYIVGIAHVGVSHGISYMVNTMMKQSEVEKMKKNPLPQDFVKNYTIYYDNWMMMQDGDFAVDSCMTGEQDLAILSEENPIYTWFGPDNQEKEVSSEVFKPYTNGKLEIIRPHWWYTGLYMCQVTSKSDAQFFMTFLRFYVIIFNPEYINYIYYYFNQAECKEEPAIRLMKMLLLEYCRGEPNCRYKVREDSCLWSNELEHFQSRFTVIQTVPESIYKDMLPSCGVVCKHKRSIDAMNKHSRPIQRNVLDNINTLYSDEGSELVFSETEVELRTICPEGFEKVDEVFCAPCPRGYFENNDTLVCYECGVFSYQDLIAQKSCTGCGWFKLTAAFGTRDIDGCMWFFKSWVAMLFIVPIGLIVCLISYLIFVNCLWIMWGIYNFICSICCICHIYKNIVKAKSEIDVRDAMGRVDMEGNDERRKLLISAPTGSVYRPNKTMINNMNGYNEEYDQMKHVGQSYDTRQSAAFLSHQWYNQYANNANNNDFDNNNNQKKN